MNKKKNEVINGFWNQNFKYMDTIVTVDKETVFNIFRKLHANEKDINYQEFTVISGQIGVKSKKARNCKLFLADSISPQAKLHIQNGKGIKRKIEDSQISSKPTTPPKTHLHKMNTNAKMVKDGKDKNEIEMFWHNHYEFKNEKENEIDTELPYELFILLHPQLKTTIYYFTTISHLNPYLKSNKVSQNCRIYYAKPKSQVAKTFHKEEGVSAAPNKCTGKQPLRNTNYTIASDFQTRSMVHNFWLSHYDCHEQNNHKILADTAYQIFLSVTTMFHLSFTQFNKHSTSYVPLKSTCRNHMKFYHAQPITMLKPYAVAALAPQISMDTPESHISSSITKQPYTLHDMRPKDISSTSRSTEEHTGSQVEITPQQKSTSHQFAG